MTKTISVLRFTILGLVAFSTGFVLSASTMIACKKAPEPAPMVIEKQPLQQPSEQAKQMALCLQHRCASEMIACYQTEGCQEEFACMGGCSSLDEAPMKKCMSACQDFSSPEADVATGSLFLCALEKCILPQEPLSKPTPTSHSIYL